MMTLVRSFLIIGWVSMASEIAPIALAETVTSDRDNSEILNSISSVQSQSAEVSETVATQSNEDTVIVAEIEGESSEVSAEISSPKSNRTPLTSRIFPCSSMQQ